MALLRCDVTMGSLSSAEKRMEGDRFEELLFLGPLLYPGPMWVYVIHGAPPPVVDD